MLRLIFLYLNVFLILIQKSIYGKTTLLAALTEAALTASEQEREGGDGSGTASLVLNIAVVAVVAAAL